MFLAASEVLFLPLQGYIRFAKGTGAFGANSIAHEPAYPIKLHPNPKGSAAVFGELLPATAAFDQA